METEVDNYRVRSRENGWVIETRHVKKSGKNAGEIDWNNPKYYSSLVHALERLQDFLFKDLGPIEGVREMIAAIRDANQKILEAATELDQQFKEYRRAS